MSLYERFWTIQTENEKRQVQIGIKKYTSDLYVHISLSKGGSPQRAISLTWGEFEKLPLHEMQNYLTTGIKTILHNQECGPDALDDNEFFDYWTEYAGSGKRWIRVGAKKYETGTYIFMKYFKKLNNIWQPPFQVNFNKDELERLKFIYPEILEYGHGLLHPQPLYFQENPFNYQDDQGYENQQLFVDELLQTPVFTEDSYEPAKKTRKLKKIN